MTRAFRRGLSHLVGWAADRKVPKPLRKLVYGAYARGTGADLSEVRLATDAFPTLGAFFVRELVPTARPIDASPDAILSPVDGTVQTVVPIDAGTVLQAKGRSYRVLDLVGGDARGLDLDGGFAWTIYLSPRDYHRIHTPERCELRYARWLGEERFSVAPKVLLKRRVLDVNERVVLELATPRGPLLLVLVGALNVGRMRVVGVDQRLAERDGWNLAPRTFERGQELARFEMGSTIVLLAPRGAARCEAGLAPGQAVRLGRPIGRWTT